HEQLVEGTDYDYQAEKKARPAFQAQDFINFYEGLDEQVIHEYRTKRAYIYGILSKNEINRDEKHNKRLFLRIQQGYYVPHPNMELPVGDGWKNSYDLVDFEGIKRRETRFNTSWIKVIEDFRRYGEENPDANVRREVRI